jgi:hypothetical protein
MSMSRYKLNASVAVSDMAAPGSSTKESSASPRYGLRPTVAGSMRPEATPRCTSIPLRPRAGESTATLATWYVDDVERVVDELASNGVTFEHCEEVTTDEKGISPRAGGGKVAWFKDPAGGAARELPPPVPGAQDGTLSC